MRFPPPIVAQTDLTRRFGDDYDALPVAVLPWNDDARTTIVVKATYDFDPNKSEQMLSLSRKQPGFNEELAHHGGQGAGDSELEAPIDLIRAKVKADVLLMGSAYGARSQDSHAATLKIGSEQSGTLFEQSFKAVGSPNDSHPLLERYLRADNGEPYGPIGPSGPYPAVDEEEEQAEEAEIDEVAIIRELITLGKIDPSEPIAPQYEALGPKVVADLLEGAEGDQDEDFEYEIDPLADPDDEDWRDLVIAGSPVTSAGQQLATEPWRCAFLDGDEVLELSGLTPGGLTRQVSLPGHEPAVVYEAHEVRLWVMMTIDTLLIDTDDNKVTLTWRGQISFDALTEPGHRIVVSLESMKGLRPLTKLYRDLQRGHFFRASVPGETEIVGLEGEQDHELNMARFRTFDITPEPTLELERFATISVDLSESEDRNAVLKAHDLSEEDWLLEERGWTSQLALALEEGRFDEAARFNNALLAERMKRGDA